MHRSPHHGLFGGRRGPEDPSARESRGVTLSLELLHLLLHFKLKGEEKLVDDNWATVISPLSSPCPHRTTVYLVLQCGSRAVGRDEVVLLVVVHL